MENKIPTAEELINKIDDEFYEKNSYYLSISNPNLFAKTIAIKFAKLHVEAVLKEVKNNILHKELSVNWEVFDKSGMLLLDDEGIEDFEKSILNSYPLENIK